MSLSVALGKHVVGEGARCFVIAEGGVNHNGKVDLAHRLVDTAADCGADAIKFQTFDTNTLVSQDAASAPYQRRQSPQSQHEMLTKLELPGSAWSEIASHAGERGIEFLSTPFDESSAHLLTSLGVPALKVPSGELTNMPLLEALASFGVPLLISTGMGTITEVEEAVKAAGSAPGIVLLHCVTAYPAPVAESNLRSITVMREAFGVPVGWSDHTLGSTTAIAAVALGAAVLEKHLTLDRTMAGPDHSASADPDGFVMYVHAVRDAEAALGEAKKQPTASEEENRYYIRRSVHAARDLEPGHILTSADTVLLRPADGLPPKAETTGRRVLRRVTAGSPVTNDDLE